MKRFLFVLLASILLCSVSLQGQTSSSQPEVSKLIAVLTKSIETKTAKAGDEVTLRSISDLSVAGELVITRGSQLTGRLLQVSLKDKENPETVLAFSIEKAVLKNGTEIPLQAIVAAIAAPRKDPQASDPAFGMMHSNEPKMVGGTSGSSPPGSVAANQSSSNSALATLSLKGKLDQPTVLDANSQGAVDIEGLAITWLLMAPPPVTVITTRSKNLKLDTGTQMLLRMAPPRRPR